MKRNRKRRRKRNKGKMMKRRKTIMMMEMTYRSRGGLNGRGAIIRPHCKVAEARDSIELETTSHGNQQSETHIALDDNHGHGDVNTGQGITVSDDTSNPEAKLSLHPDGLWFGHHDVFDVVVVETSYKTYFKEPYYNWGVTPAEVKDRWWNAFKVCTVPTYAATWCAPALRAHFKQIRDEDEDFKRRSSQCSKNRLRNESQRVHHRQGSISAEEVKINLDDFKKKKAANLECEDETQKKSEDELLGAAAHSYYGRPTYEEKNGKKSRRDYIKSLETQVVELAAKNDDQKKELDQTKQELDQTKTQQVLIETKKTLIETTKSFMTFKQQVEKFMQANPP
ncbi:Alanine--tRNA ligase cytoplasmic, partial [Bienertia sinuspersici]